MIRNLTVAMLTLAMAGSAWAEEPKGGKPGAEGKKGDKPGAEGKKGGKPGAEAKGAPSEAEKAMMEAMERASKAGPEHERLKGMVGRWKGAATFWMPDGKTMQSSNTVERKVAMGGRYLVEQYRGQFMGKPFEGAGWMGYDNLKKKWVGAWIDSGGTGIMYSEGTLDEAGKVLTMVSENMIDPMTNKPTRSRNVTRYESPDREVMEMWGPGPDGKDMKMFEIVLTRVK